MSQRPECYSCDCTFSTGCKAERVAAAAVSSPHVSKGSVISTPAPAPRKRPQYPGIRQYALQQTAARRSAREARKIDSINKEKI